MFAVIQTQSNESLEKGVIPIRLPTVKKRNTIMNKKIDKIRLFFC